MQYSARRTVEALKTHILLYLRDVLQENKLGQKQLRIWSTSESEVQCVLQQLDRLREQFEFNKRMQAE